MEEFKVIDSRGRKTLLSGPPGSDVAGLLDAALPYCNSPALGLLHCPLPGAAQRYLRVTAADAVLRVRAGAAEASVVVPLAARASRIRRLIERLSVFCECFPGQSLVLLVCGREVRPGGADPALRELLPAAARGAAVCEIAGGAPYAGFVVRIFRCGEDPLCKGLTRRRQRLAVRDVLRECGAPCVMLLGDRRLAASQRVDTLVAVDDDDALDVVPVLETPELRGELYDRADELVDALCFLYRSWRCEQARESPPPMRVVPQVIAVEGGSPGVELLKLLNSLGYWFGLAQRAYRL
jgi:hypothetical protein